MKQLINAHKYYDAEQLVHKNKGGSGNIGAKRIHVIASELQKALKSEDEKESLKLLDLFIAALSELVASIRDMIKSKE